MTIGTGCTRLETAAEASFKLATTVPSRRATALERLGMREPASFVGRSSPLRLVDCFVTETRWPFALESAKLHSSQVALIKATRPSLLVTEAQQWLNAAVTLQEVVIASLNTVSWIDQSFSMMECHWHHISVLVRPKVVIRQRFKRFQQPTFD